MTQQTQDLREQRDALDLHASLLDPKTRELVIRSFESRLTEYMVRLLNPDLSETEALAIRYKAIGLVESMNHMADTMRAVEEPIRRAAQKNARASLAGSTAGNQWG